MTTPNPDPSGKFHMHIDISKMQQAINIDFSKMQQQIQQINLKWPSITANWPTTATWTTNTTNYPIKVSWPNISFSPKGKTLFQEGFEDKGDWDTAQGSVFGIRTWMLVPEGLVGQYWKTWKTSDFKATCGIGNCPRSPGPDCVCGIYAYWQQPDPANIVSIAQSYVWGVVEGYGRVVIGTNGFKAEKARILGICGSPYLNQFIPIIDTKKVLKRLYRISTIFNVPFYNSPDEMLKAHPLTTNYLQKDS